MLSLTDSKIVFFSDKKIRSDFIKETCISIDSFPFWVNKLAFFSSPFSQAKNQHHSWFSQLHWNVIKASLKKKNTALDPIALNLLVVTGTSGTTVIKIMTWCELAVYQESGY